VLKTESAIYK